MQVPGTTVLQRACPCDDHLIIPPLLLCALQLATGPALGWANGQRIPAREKSRISAAAARNLEYVKLKDATERRKRLGLQNAAASILSGQTTAADWQDKLKSSSNYTPRI